MKEIVAFFLSGKEYGIEVEKMQGIENYRDMLLPPDRPEYVMGFVVIRGEKIPVVDIKKCLLLPPAERTVETKYIVMRTSYGKLALVSDGLGGIFKVDGANAQNFPPLAQAKRADYMDFVARCGTDLVLVLSPDKLLNAKEWKKVAELVDNMEDEDD